MAKLKLRLTDLADVPEALRDFYREVEGGGYMIDHEADPDGYGIGNIANLNGKLNEAQAKKLKTEQNLLKKEDGSLYTMAEIEALQAQLGDATKLAETLKDKDKSTEEKFLERLRSEMQPLQDKLTKSEQRAKSLQTKVHGAEADRVVDKIVKQLNPLPEWEAMLRREIKSHIKVEEGSDGEIKHQIIDPETGSPRYSSLTGADGLMGIDEFAKSEALRKPYGQCLKGDGKEGAGPIDQGSPGRNTSPRGKDIVLSPDVDQKTFEAAVAKASEAGGEVVFSDGGA